MIVGVLLLAVLANLGTSRDAGPRASTVAATEESVVPAGASTVLAVQKYVTMSPTQMYSALKRDLGASGGVKRDKVEGDYLGFARFHGGHIEVFENTGRVEQINAFFDPPARNWAHALVLLGLPHDLKPTREVPAAYVWEGTYANIGEVWALREPIRGTRIRGVMLKLPGS